MLKLYHYGKQLPTTLKSLVGVDIKYSLTIDDCKMLTFDLFPIVTTREITSVNDFFSMVIEKQGVILLILNESNIGHYVAFTFNPQTKLLSYYDSYANNYTDYGNQVLNRLITGIRANLSERSGFRFEMNTNKQQVKSRSINNCGRYSCLRVLMNDYDNASFNRLMDSSLKDVNTTDDVVCLLTGTLGLAKRDNRR